MDEQDAINYPPYRAGLLRRARVERETDDLEIDDDANLSPGDEGCWVQGWVWIRHET